MEALTQPREFGCFYSKKSYPNQVFVILVTMSIMSRNFIFLFTILACCYVYMEATPVQNRIVTEDSSSNNGKPYLSQRDAIPVETADLPDLSPASPSNGFNSNLANLPVGILHTPTNRENQFTSTHKSPNFPCRPMRARVNLKKRSVDLLSPDCCYIDPLCITSAQCIN